MKKLYRDVKVERYFPDVLAPAKEFKEIAAAEDPEYALMYDTAWKWFANTFIFDTDIDGVRRWESMLSITPDADATLEDRRMALYTAINFALPYTERSFKNLCDALYWENAVIPEVIPNEYALILSVDREMLKRTSALLRYARLIAPANLTVKATYGTTLDWPIYVGGAKEIKKAITIYPANFDETPIGGLMYTGIVGKFAKDERIYSEHSYSTTGDENFGGVVRLRKTYATGDF